MASNTNLDTRSPVDSSDEGDTSFSPSKLPPHSHSRRGQQATAAIHPAAPALSSATTAAIIMLFVVTDEINGPFTQGPTTATYGAGRYTDDKGILRRKEQKVVDYNRHRLFIKKCPMEKRAMARDRWGIDTDSEDERLEGLDPNRHKKSDLKRKAGDESNGDEDGDDKAEDSVDKDDSRRHTTASARKFKKSKVDEVDDGAPGSSRAAAAAAAARSDTSASLSVLVASPSEERARQESEDRDFQEAIRRSLLPPSSPSIPQALRRPIQAPTLLDTSLLDILAEAASAQAAADARDEEGTSGIKGLSTSAIAGPSNAASLSTTTTAKATTADGPPTQGELRAEILRTWPRELGLPPFLIKDPNDKKEWKTVEKERKRLRKEAGLPSQWGDGKMSKGARPWQTHSNAGGVAQKYFADLRKAAKHYGGAGVSQGQLSQDMDNETEFEVGENTGVDNGSAGDDSDGVEEEEADDEYSKDNGKGKGKGKARGKPKPKQKPKKDVKGKGRAKR